MKRLIALTTAVALATVAYMTPTGAAVESDSAPVVTVLNKTALGGLGSGSTIGPDGSLYVTNGIDGTLLRVNPTTGAATVVGSGLPPLIMEVGCCGAMDVAFIGRQAYVLVSTAGSDWGGDRVMGIYRLKPNGTFSVFANIGKWSKAHPPADPDWFAGQGVQYAMEVWRGGFVVSDGHLARVIRVNRQGRVSELMAFASTDAVPTGLEVADGKVFVTTSGPIPHVPGDAAINMVRRNGSVKVVGAWGPGYTGNRGLNIDVEQGRQGRLYGLLQGYWDLEPTPENEGYPAKARTGEIVVVRPNGTFKTVVSRLDQPTSMELVGRVAFVVTFTGKILRIDGM